MEVASGEYGHEFLDRMVELIDNGRLLSYKPSPNIIDRYEKIKVLSTVMKRFLELGLKCIFNGQSELLL